MDDYEWANPPAQPEPPHLRDKLLDLDSLFTLPEPDWLIEKILPSGALVIAYGEPGHYKSFAALDWSLCVATGTKWAGLACKQGSVIYVIAEGVSGTPRRVRAWMEHHDIKTIPDARWLPCSVNLLVETQVTQLLDIVGEMRPALVVIDTLARNTAGAEENSSKDMGLAMDAAARIIAMFGTTVVIVHHTSKDGMNYRGSTAIEGAADTMWHVVHEGLGVVRFKNTKQKDAAALEDFMLQALPVNDSVVLSCVSSLNFVRPAEHRLLDILAKDFLSTSASVGQWADVGEVSTKTIQRIASSLVRQGFVENVGTVSRPRYVLTELGTGQLDNQVDTP